MVTISSCCYWGATSGMVGQLYCLRFFPYISIEQSLCTFLYLESDSDSLRYVLQTFYRIHYTLHEKMILRQFFGLLWRFKLPQYLGCNILVTVANLCVTILLCGSFQNCLSNRLQYLRRFEPSPIFLEVFVLNVYYGRYNCHKCELVTVQTIAFFLKVIYINFTNCLICYLNN